MYAIDVAALTSLRVRDDFILKMLLGEIVDRDPDHAIDCAGSKKFVVKGAPFLCDDERAWAITAIIRKRYERYELPIYRKEKGRWKRV